MQAGGEDAIPMTACCSMQMQKVNASDFTNHKVIASGFTDTNYKVVGNGFTNCKVIASGFTDTNSKVVGSRFINTNYKVVSNRFTNTNYEVVACGFSVANYCCEVQILSIQWCTEEAKSES